MSTELSASEFLIYVFDVEVLLLDLPTEIYSTLLS
jgi:hypothetical protein